MMAPSVMTDVVRRSWFLVLGLVGACDGGVPLERPREIETLTIPELRARADAFDGRPVVLPNVVVLAQDAFDEVGSGRTGTVYFADPGGGRGDGLQAFAARVALPPGDLLEPGDVVDVRGTFVRFRGPNCPERPELCFRGRTLDQMAFGAIVERVGWWLPLEPIELSVADYRERAWEVVGSLVTLRGLTVSALYEPSADGTRLRALETEQGVEIGADLHVIEGIAPGDCLRRVTGIASYFFSDFVLPRGSADVEVGVPGDCPPAAP
ncbi:MAG: hypothetical protein NZ898_04985 [Myxococcota bacterium]|nr:hypothetical protein [Myxococcota bacterium]MDW8362882.1 hypothetical protein [Myxococcales bacterium]